MNPIKALIEAFITIQAELRARANKAIANLGEIEKIEASQPVISALREMDWVASRLTDFAQTIDERVKSLDEHIQKIEGDAVTAAIAAGTVVKKEDHDAQITAARTAGETAARDAFAAQRQAEAAAAARRSELAGEIGEVAAAALSDADLAAEDAEARIGRLRARVTKLGETGITAAAHGPAYKDLLGCPLDEAGEALFAARVAGYEAVLASASAGQQPPKPTKPEGTLHAGAGAPPAGGEGRKAPVI